MTAESGRDSAAITAPRTTPAMVKNRRAAPTTSPASALFFCPSFWPSKIVMPIVRPVRRPVIVMMTWLPVETAETAAESPKYPTIMRSTPPYMACSRIEKNIGTEKRSSGPRIFPSVKSFVSFNTSPPK